MNRLSSIPSSTLNHIEQNSAIYRQVTAEQKVSALKEKFKSALINVATQRKVIYDIIVDLKEHFQEYGFKCPADAVTSVCQRSKSWANKFLVEIESELEIFGEVANSVATPTSPKEKEQLDTLNAVSKLPDPTATNSQGGSDAVAATQKPATNNGSGAKQTNETAPAAVVDVTGLKIPECALKTWALRDSIQELITLSSKLRCALDEAFQTHQYLFHPRRWDKQVHADDMAAIHYQLTQVKPDVLCPVCNGTMKDDMGRDCGECCATGFISKTRWHNEYEKCKVSFIQQTVSERNGKCNCARIS